MSFLTDFNPEFQQKAVTMLQIGMDFLHLQRSFAAKVLQNLFI